MIRSVATWKTDHAPKYLVQLCKHFAHKIEVSYSEAQGECRFVCGTVRLEADEQGLRMEATSPDLDQLQQTESVIERHLVRFAFRENLEALAWQRIDAPVETGQPHAQKVTS
ncbi:DUF2218 domain-containing protein [Rhizobium sp. RU36D]|uniref:DUF2218 domain-containing protein n=1 Tax=Rhizobium sp. RU36D TaxID=1907415 RepID=UPI0009D854B6|nr:DUF2218 domain-containing protein [Rhizobium sp. RU36D]SMC95078.1 hypothetical protein SAMN05880593_111142 [Rhizobium sp. RU36D]